MELEIVDRELKTVRHNSCKRGVDYAKQEFYDPRRIVTATAAVTGSVVKRVPVRTNKPLPMKHIYEVLQAIYALKLAAPLDIGVPVIKNIPGTGIDVITTRNVRKDV
jgi:CxxC motif-containing protein